MKPRVLWLLPLFISLTGCEAIRSVLPSAGFDRLDLRSINWSGVETDFVFSVNNPSPVEIEIVRFDYALEFDGNEWATGESVDALNLSAFDQSEMVLPLNIAFAELFDAVNPAEGEDTLPYGISGSIGFDTPAGILDLPFSHAGEFPALRAPRIIPTGLRVDNLNILGGEVDMTIEMVADNQHASAFQFDDFRFRVMMSDTDVIAGHMEELGQVEGGETERFELPVQLKLLELGSVVYSAILAGDGEVDLGLDVSANVVTPFGTIPLSSVENADVGVR